ncbi:hypothetical protein GRF59_04290 [Paenibacillus sp. HJL G12]|uniref:DUF11 domain-containing protein n=1 Tax=Paenibacillus dendrobii TaxID=2691084 RepID=A0A7X3IFA8_9BACL|nr:hypothetical protein [Paenibacillus dendrobii]MWV42839.1 hypothetical protein [Paenibacillus dendrobii]
MNKSIKIYAAVLVSTLLVSQIISNGAYAGAASITKTYTTTSFTLDKLGTVTLKRQFSVKLMNVDMFAQPSGNILIYTLQYTNGTGSSMDLIDYFSKVTTTGGTVVQGKPVTRDVAIKKVPAQSGQTVTYYVNIGKAAKISGVKISMFGWDFNSSNYQKSLGSFTIPNSYSTVASQGQSKKIMMNDLPVTAKAESMQKEVLNGKVYLRVGVSLVNAGSKVLNDPGYKAYLRSAGGSVFELALEEGSSHYKVQPLEKKTINYLAEVPSYMKTDNMILQFAQEDPALKFNLPIQSFNLPALSASDSAVGDYSIKKLTIDKNAVETQLKSATIYTENESAKWSLQFRIKNLGNKPVTLPAYDLAIKAVEGYSIPVDSKELAHLSIKPLEERLIELTAMVPLKLNQSSLQLVLSEPYVDDKIIFPAARYKIPYSQESNYVLGMEYPLENDHGRFAVKLDAFQRLPWADGDQITAKISLRNTTGNTVQLPPLKALVKAGMNDLSGSAQIVSGNGHTTLAPNESAEMYVLAKVPYTYNISQLRIVLQEIAGENVKKFLSMNTSAVNTVMNSVAAGGSYHVDTMGKKAELRERRSTVYGDNGSNLMYTELEMINEEPRQSKPSQLVAYYKSDDNQYYESVVTQSSSSISPGGKSLVTVWSKLPRNVNTSKLMLYIGEGVTDSMLTDAGGEASGYINTFSLHLTPTAVKPASNLKDVDMFPYSLSIAKAESTLTEGTDTLNTVLHYSLSQNGDFEAGAYEHKLVLELTDPFGQSTEKSLTLGTDWTIGNSKSFSITLTSNLYNTLKGGSIRVNLYDEFQGRRILLGSQSYPIIYLRAETSSVNP